ncbi:SdpA family antimicrobial peptide system protein [Cytophagaceae bacterium DM2B3-1]|uniref:SdpA family antimicrobial peptide system protein n=1 Tax=Xanthocytophaga flava TaxID=3048013 RepID=A0ABT7CVG8_9BACT|nr:SdpA family antimicrobial peptide system protein [Xanthocytophaga flavus]MDJ1473278.1 SdpA family antimicrobial peptide system protein [Xanthocytophaga flavus]MDJ1497764.1 SdpA family antimicrobial peptide system protein [Xanthocytophaga flavus]
MNATFKIAIWIGWALVFYISALCYIDNSTLLSYEFKKHFTYMVPQGWAFFTKDPKEALVEIYRLSPDNRLELVTYNNTSHLNYFGISRRSRAIAYQLSPLVSSIPREAWINGIGELNVDKESKVFDIKLKKKLTYFPAGVYVVYQYKPIPLEWAHQKQEQYRPYLIAKVRVIY